MESLPYEVLETLFSFLPLVDQKSVKLTCRRFYHALSRPLFLSSYRYVLREGIEDSSFLFTEGVNQELSESRDIRSLPSPHDKWALQSQTCTQNHHSSTIPASASSKFSEWGRFVTDLSFEGRDVNSYSLTALLSVCLNLCSLDISGCNSLFDTRYKVVGCSNRVREGRFLEKEPERYQLRNSVGISLQRISLANITSLQNEDVLHILQTFLHVRDIDLSGCFIDSTAHVGSNGISNLIVRPQLSFRSFLSALRDLSVNCFGGVPLCFNLRLNSTDITDRDVESLCCCKHVQLRGISVDNCHNLTDRGITALFSSVHLVNQLNEFSIGLPSPDVTFSAVLPYLKVVGPNLKRLSFSKLPISSKTHLSSLVSNCCNVEHLDISSCCAGFIGWSEYLWMNLHYISSLDLSGHFTLSDDDVSVMSLCLRDRLKYLNVSSCMKLTDISLEVIFRNFSSSLEVLNANWCKGFSDVGVLGTNRTSGSVTGFSACTRLKELNFSDCHQVTGRSFRSSSDSYIPLFHNLVHLYLGRVGHFQGDDLVSLCNSAPFLQSLDVSRSSVDDCSLNIVFNKLDRTLRKINLSGCEELTDLSLKNLAERIPYFRVLDVSFCPHISQKSLQEFKACMPYLSELKALYVGASLIKTESSTLSPT
ncbi:F-box and leucine-rich repeat protein 14 [Fasciola gigantica]|uniref:F-box and leucine-rich repeat protein 14 n=1 Tax=Fasciola gigantica TaxID=46835 RepID=A0A504YZH8_FASGI|nr:F-box and leucine-rich repeat protein 14 [Fasciola gigantica]